MGKALRIAKWVVGITLAMGLILGGAAAFIVPKVQTVMQERAQAAAGKQVVVEAARRDALTRLVSAPGTVEPKAFANISSRVSAKIEEMPFDEGDHVKEGDVLVRLDSRDLEASLAAAQARYLADEASHKSAEANLIAEEARILGARASYQNSVADFERQQELFASGDISQSELDRASTEMNRSKATYEAQVAGLDTLRANVEAARARAEASRAEVDRAQRNLEYATITAPFDGLITQRTLNVGEVALGTISNQGATIMVLEDQSEMLIEGRLAELDAPKVDEGQKVRCYVNGFPDQTFEGIVRKVGGRAQRWAADNTMYVEAEVVVETQGMPIKSGTTANIDVEIETIEDILVVPSQAVLDKRVDSLPQKIREENPLVDREKTFVRAVFVMADGKAVLTPVKTISSNLVRTALGQGVEEGHDVIVGPFAVLQQLGHNDSVRVRGAEDDADATPEASTAVAADSEETTTDDESTTTDDDDSAAPTSSAATTTTASTAG